MIAKWFIIFCALAGAWYVMPVWFPSIGHIAFTVGDISFQYKHIAIAIIIICGWKLNTD
jgi:hypothetical protein